MSRSFKPLEGNALFNIPNSAEEAMRISALRHATQDKHEQNMYQDAAKRVVFRNCMSSCDITDEMLPNFNANFYYNEHG